MLALNLVYEGRGEGRLSLHWFFGVAKSTLLQRPSVWGFAINKGSGGQGVRGKVKVVRWTVRFPIEESTLPSRDTLGIVHSLVVAPHFGLKCCK